MIKKIIIILLVVIVGLAGGLYWDGHSGHEIEHSDKPRILLTHLHPSCIGGHYTFLSNLVSSGLKDKYDFALASDKEISVFDVLEVAHIPRFEFQFRYNTNDWGHIINEAIHFRKICKEFQPDIIHANGEIDSLIAVWSTLGLRKSPKIIRTFHETKVIEKNLQNWLVYKNRMSAAMFVSKYPFEYSNEKGGLHLDNVFIIENAIDLDKFKPQAPDIELKKKLKIPGNYFVFGSNAGLAPYKRVDLILQAAQMLKDQFEFKIVLLGQPDAIEMLKELAKNLGVSECLCYMGSCRDVRPYLSFFDIGFVLSDSIETISYASREMLAMGIPLISSNFSGLRENIINDYNGELIEPSNVKELVNAMKFFMTMPPSELQKYKEHAREHAIKCFDSHIQFAKIDQMYQSVLSK